MDGLATIAIARSRYHGATLGIIVTTHRPRGCPRAQGVHYARDLLESHHGCPPPTKAGATCASFDDVFASLIVSLHVAYIPRRIICSRETTRADEAGRICDQHDARRGDQTKAAECGRCRQTDRRAGLDVLSANRNSPRGSANWRMRARPSSRQRAIGTRTDGHDRGG